MSRGARIGIWIAIGAAIAVLFAITAARRLEKKETQSIQAIQQAEGIPVDVVEARVIPVEDWRVFTGAAEGFDQTDLVADFRTRVSAVHVQTGDVVPRGKVIVSLDRFDPGRAEMNMETTRSAYETARIDSGRMEELFRAGAISKQQLDHTRSACDAARVAWISARRAVELDTPIAGVVTAIHMEPGEYAAAGQVLATISSYDRIRIPLELSESERALVEKGRPVRLFLKGSADGGRETRLDGEVVKAAISADPRTRLYRVEVEIRNPDHLLKPGALVSPEILVDSSKDLPVVPAIALLRHDHAARLFVLAGTGEDPRAELRDVRLGASNGDLVAIAEGLRPGERVVVAGQTKLGDGVKAAIHADRTEAYLGAER